MQTNDLTNSVSYQSSISPSCSQSIHIETGSNSLKRKANLHLPSPQAKVRKVIQEPYFDLSFVKADFTADFGSIADQFIGCFPARFNLSAWRNAVKDKEHYNGVVALQLKWIGHVFGLHGKYSELGFKDNDIEGCRDYLSTSWIADTYTKYLDTLSNSVRAEDIELLREMAYSSVAFSLRNLKDVDYKKIVNDINNGQPVSLPTGWQGHYDRRHRRQKSWLEGLRRGNFLLFSTDGLSVGRHLSL